MSPASAARQTVFFAGSTGVAQLATICVYVLTARLSPLPDFGATVAAVALAMTLAGFVDFGSNNLWVREVSAARRPAAAFSARAMGKALVALVVSIAWMIGALTLGLGMHVMLAGLIVTSVVVSQTSAVPIRGALATHLLSVGVVLDRAIALTMYFVLLLAHVTPVVAMTVSLATGPLVGCITNVLLSRRHNGFEFAARIENPWKGSRHLGIAATAISAQTLDTPLLTAVGGVDASGLYGSVSRWTQPMGLLSSAFATTAGPFIARAGSVRRAWTGLRRALWLPGLAVLFCVLIAVLAPTVVPMVLGARYADAAPVLQLVSLAAVLSILAQPLFTTLQYLSRERTAAWILVSAVSTQLVLVVLLGSVLGAVGAAIASGVAQLVIVVFSLVAVMRIKDQTDES